MKKGFTLIELLGVIVILGIIGLIATPIVQGTIEKNNTKACMAQIESFKKAAKNYVNTNPFTNLQNSKNITVGELIDGGYIENKELKNPKGGTFSRNSIINIKYQDSKTSYQYIKDSSETDCED